MGRRPKPVKVNAARSPAARKPRKNESERIRDLEKRLAEALEQLETRSHEVRQAQEQQAATSEILKVISSSPTDTQRVFETIAQSTVQLCGSLFSAVYTFSDGLMWLVAHRNFPPDAVKAMEALYPAPPGRETAAGRALLDRTIIEITDVLADREYGRDLQSSGGWRSTFAVPMLSEGTPIGAIAAGWAEPGPASPASIAILQTFADQAAIAIENGRLFKELRARNRDLTEALERQTATSEILRLISRFQTNVEPVFDAIAARALDLCRATTGWVYRFDGEMINIAAAHSLRPEAVAVVRQSYPMPPSRGGATARAVLSRSIVYIPDIREDHEYRLEALARAADYLSVVAVPMMLEGKPIGIITVTGAQAGAFSPRQIELLQTFADQAVIAVENVRLFTELQEKNRALTESLEQQTATADILQAISRSPTEVEPVFEAVVTNAARLCQAHDVAMLLVEGDNLRLVAGAGPLYMSIPPDFRIRVTRGSAATRAVVDRATVHIHDFAAESEEEYPVGRELARRFGHRSMLAVPLLREGVPIGVICAFRSEVRPFPDQQIALLRTFADQAVIAVENVRLFKELEARTADLSRSVDQLTALGEVGRAVSSTLDLETVLTTIVSRAVELSGLDGGVVFEYDEGHQEFVQRAQAETGGALAAARRATRIPKGKGVVGRTALTLEPVQVLDITAPGAYIGPNRENLIESGVRAVLAVPMVCEGQLIGCLGVTRNQPGEFPAETIELLRTFATQSALAIQNARLFQEIEDKGRQLEAASRHKSEFLANMSHELRTPLNAIIGFSEVLSERMFGDLNEKQDEYVRDIHASGQHLLSLINDILDLSKIEAGRMELELTDFDLPAAIENAVTLVRERAGRRGIALHPEVDARLGQIRGDERKLKQVLLNLLSNAIKFTPEGGRIELRAGLVDGVAEVSVVDTGIGIAPEDHEAVFEEFRQVGTAARKVEGTGLGLALSRKFIELHGGRIWVTSRVGTGSTFTFTLPLQADQRA
jgi:signal transduction histidine kinase